MVNNNNLFKAFKFSYIIGKIFGSISFSVKDFSNFQKIEISKTDKIISCVHIFLVSVILLICSRRIHEYFSSDIITILALVLMLIYFSLIITVIAFGIINRTKISKIWLRLFRFSKWLEFVNLFVNYDKLKFVVNFVILFLFFAAISYSIFDYLSETSLNIVIFYEICTLVAVSMESQIIMLLLSVKTLAKLLNKYIISTDFTKLSEKQKNNYLKNIMKKHYELFDICKRIDKSFNFMIVRTFTTIFDLSFCAFNISITNIEMWIFYVDCILWCLTNLFSSALIIFFCEASKLEV